MWEAITAIPTNITLIIRFLVSEGNYRGGSFVTMAEAVCTHYATTHLEATINAVRAELHQILFSSTLVDSPPVGQLHLAPMCPDPTPDGHFAPDVDSILPIRCPRNDIDVSCVMSIMGELAARCQHTWGDELVMLIHYCCLCFEHASGPVLDLCRRVLLNLVLNVSTGTLKQFAGARKEVLFPLGSVLDSLYRGY